MTDKFYHNESWKFIFFFQIKLRKQVLQIFVLMVDDKNEESVMVSSQKNDFSFNFFI